MKNQRLHQTQQGRLILQTLKEPITQSLEARQSLQRTHLSQSLIHEQGLHLPNFILKETLPFGYEEQPLNGLFLRNHTVCHNPPTN